MRGAKFELGTVVVTPRAEQLLERQGWTVEKLLARHQAGDWGDVSAAEWRVNDEGIDQALNLVSTYVLDGRQRLSVVTKGDRSATIVHLAPGQQNGH